MSASFDPGLEQVLCTARVIDQRGVIKGVYRAVRMRDHCEIQVVRNTRGQLRHVKSLRYRQETDAEALCAAVQHMALVHMRRCVSGLDRVEVQR